jgi:PAS domain S-box-containing protein
MDHVLNMHQTSPQTRLRGSGFEPVLRALSEAVYTTDAAGHITFYNEAAAELWGVRPELGRSEFCGSWKLYWPDGTPLPHSECPMAIALREQRPNRGYEAIAERPDGSRVRFQPSPTPLFDEHGTMIGAVNMLIDVTERHRTQQAAQMLAAIVESSEDAILSKDLNGYITSWNQGAQRLFGYVAHEIVGKHVTTLIPPDRLDEEPVILDRIHRGERVEHFETIRRRKDGSLIDISLTISPIRAPDGRIIGASKIARDITDKRQAEETQKLLLREMDHRVKNLFTLASSVVSLSARSADSADTLAAAVRDRLSALAQAHALTLTNRMTLAPSAIPSTTLQELLRTILKPYAGTTDDGTERATISGADIEISGSSLTSLALLLHEFATNAAKYGALSTPSGRVEIECAMSADKFELTWRERGGPAVAPATSEGFGSLIARATVQRQLGGEMTRQWDIEGLTIRLVLALDRLRV